MPGHLLVVPRRHVEKLFQLTSTEMNDLWELVMKYQEKILQKIASGCDIKINYRPFQKQSRLKVHHLHIHLQPRELFDELYQKSQIYETDLFRDLTEEELGEMKSRLKH